MWNAKYTRYLLQIAAFLVVTKIIWYFFFPSRDDINNTRQINNAKRANAVIVVLARNSDLDDLLDTLTQLEDTFNAFYNYPYVFLNEQPFEAEFQKAVLKLLTSKSPASPRNLTFGKIPIEHWSYPSWIDQKKAAYGRMLYSVANVKYGESESYRHMCRFYSGFFYKNPLLLNYDYYWRVEPGAKFYCQLNYDPFLFMIENKKQYGFMQMLPELNATIPTLWNTTVQFLKEVYPSLLATKPTFPALSLLLDFSVGLEQRKAYAKQLLSSSSAINSNIAWSTCHFWSNFEIGNFNFFRSKVYQSYFDYLDKAGGFFYERWGDAPVHTLAIGMFLDASEIHHFREIGYQHLHLLWCPKESAFARRKCSCNAPQEFTQLNKAEQADDPCLCHVLEELKQSV